MWSGGGRANTLLTNFYFNFSLDCGQEEFLAWDEKNGECFTNPWNTAAKRRKLWCTCNRPGREIGTLLLYGMGEMIDHAMKGDGCNSEDISLIRTTLSEGHSAVDNLQVSSLSWTCHSLSYHTPISHFWSWVGDISTLGEKIRPGGCLLLFWRVFGLSSIV